MIICALPCALPVFWSVICLGYTHTLSAWPSPYWEKSLKYVQNVNFYTRSLYITYTKNVNGKKKNIVQTKKQQLHKTQLITKKS